MSTSPSLIERINRAFTSFLEMKAAWIPKATKIIWLTILALFIFIPLYIFTVKVDLFHLYGGMPDIHEVENPENDLSSEVLSADGVSLGRYFRYNRSQVTFDDLSDDLVNTLIISEDHRFYSHSGLDLEAFVRVVFGVLTLHPTGGGSTITQQLAKNLYTKNPNRSLDGYIAGLGRFPRRVVEKTKEWIIAVDLEKNFTKKEIIAMYFNTMEFSSNTYGIKVAAETYFNKEPDSLNLQESAVLVGMLQNPSRYNPKKYPERALSKRNEVLFKVYKHDYKLRTREQYDSICRLPLGLNFNIQNQNQGLATYFRTVLSSYLMNYCKKKGLDLWNSGLKIYTTLDSRAQRYAEEAMNAHMKVLQARFYSEWKMRDRDPWSDEDGAEIPDFLQRRVKQTEACKDYVRRFKDDAKAIQKAIYEKRKMTIFTWKGERDTLFSTMDSLNYYKRFLQAGLLAMDPHTGHVKAWVGGFNYKYFKFDHVVQGKRQPGSTFKPFVYGLAMESGYSPCQVLKDISPQFVIDGQDPWYPPNADGSKGSGRSMNLRQAMARSVNSITAQMIQSLGAKNVVEFAHRVGILSPLAAVPSLCLGTSDVSLLEMVDAYCTFVNGGLQIKPLLITRIEDKNGNVIENFVADTRHAINEQTAYKMLYMLKGGVEEKGGTSRGVSWELKSNNDLGGKTGTTNDASDGWYVGVTHNLVCGVWVGGDERAIRFPSWSFGQGSKTARPIWEKFMLSVYADPSTGIKKGYFQKPVSGVDVSLDCKDAPYIPEERDDDQPIPERDKEEPEKDWDISR